MRWWNNAKKLFSGVPKKKVELNRKFELKFSKAYIEIQGDRDGKKFEEILNIKKDEIEPTLFPSVLHPTNQPTN